jgi:outer membrane beta-barrel protein
MPSSAFPALPLLRRAAALTALLGLSGCAFWPFSHREPAPAGEAVLPSEEPPGQVIEPGIARREVKVPKIRAENFEIGAFTGILDVEDLQSHLIYGVRGAYHVTEDFFLEAEYGRSGASDTVRREIGQPFFPQETVGLNTYSMNLGYNLLPGEVFVGTRYAMTSTFYLLAGAGNTSFNKNDYLTYNAGFGLKVLPRDWLSVRLEARDRIWQSDLLGTNKLTNNFEMTLGLAAYF